jgi:hypothetical protein
MRPGLAPWCRRTNSPGGGPSPSLWGGGLCGRTGASPVTPCTCSSTANAPSPLRGAGRTLDRFLVTLQGLVEALGRWDAIPATVTVWLPPPRVQAHARRCSNDSSTMEHIGTGRRFTYSCTPYGPTSAAPSSLSEDITAIRRPSTLEPPLFGYKIGHDGRIAARIVRTAAHSTA